MAQPIVGYAFCGQRYSRLRSVGGAGSGKVSAVRTVSLAERQAHLRSMEIKTHEIGQVGRPTSVDAQENVEIGIGISEEAPIYSAFPTYLPICRQ